MKRSRTDDDARGSNDSRAAPAPLRQAVRRCRGEPAFLDALRGVYRTVDEAVNRRGALCLGGGACCRFDLMGHRLMLSTGELALLTLRPPPGGRGAGRLPCAYQRGPRCAARRRRPLGCRVYFCRAELEDFCHQTYEASHERIRRLHERHALPYAYVELTAALNELRPKNRDRSIFRNK